MKISSPEPPSTDPTQIYRYRDGLYAEDMLLTGIVWLEVLLMHSTEGRCHGASEMSAYLQKAGFQHPKLTLTAAARSLITADKRG